MIINAIYNVNASKMLAPIKFKQKKENSEMWNFDTLFTNKRLSILEEVWRRKIDDKKINSLLSLTLPLSVYVSLWMKSISGNKLGESQCNWTSTKWFSKIVMQLRMIAI